MTQLFDDLEYAGFIERFHPIDKNEHSRLIRIRINDEFLNFYFSIITRNKTAIEQNTVKAYELLTGSVFEQWRGYAFERLCRKHAADIAKALEFSGIRYKSGSWFRAQHDTKVQIDLVFFRADNVTTVCELKYVNTIDALNLISGFKRKMEYIKSVHPTPVQKVLTCAKKITIPEKVKDYFDVILFTKDIFRKW